MPANIRLDDDIQTYEQVLNQDKKDFPNNFWTGTDGKDRLKKLIRYLCEYKFGWQKEKIPRSVNDDTFKNYHLIGGISICYQGSVLNAMLAAYPEFTKEDFKGTALYDQQRKRYKDPAKEYPGVNMDFNNMTDDQLQNDLGLEPEKDYKQVANKIKRRLLKM